MGYSTHCQPFTQGVPSSQRAQSPWPSFALSFGLLETDTALTSTSPRAGRTRAQPGETQGCLQYLSKEFWGMQEHVSMQQACQWRRAVGCRQGLHQLLGNPSHGLSPAGWMAQGELGCCQCRRLEPCPAGLPAKIT